MFDTLKYNKNEFGLKHSVMIVRSHLLVYLSLK